MAVFPEWRERIYVKDFGSVFGLDICETDRADYQRANNAMVKAAFMAGRDKGYQKPRGAASTPSNDM